jgi:hypothetical protein
MIALQIFALLLTINQLCYAENVTSSVDGRYINKLPISVTDVPEAEKLQLKLVVPKGFCQASLVKRDSNGFHKKEYMLCEDLPQRVSDKMFYILYNEGSSMNSAKELMEMERDRLTTKVCSGYRIIYEASYDQQNYSQADLIISCSDIKNNRKVVMLTSFFAGEKDASAFHYDIRMPIEDPEEFTVDEILSNINNGGLTILKAGEELVAASCGKNYQNTD